MISKVLLQRLIPGEMFYLYKDSKHYSLATSEECSDDESEKSTLNGKHQSPMWIRPKPSSIKLKIFVFCSVLLNTALVVVVAVISNRSHQPEVSHWGKSDETEDKLQADFCSKIILGHATAMVEKDALFKY
jgi:hypothetical protein